MQINIHNKVGARFKLIVHKGDGFAVRETNWFHNIVLDSGLAQMSAGTWINRCCVGSGNSTPLPEQANLDNFIASTNTKISESSSSNPSSPPYYVSAKVTWRFDEGVAAGNLSEVGLGWSNVNLWNRALIKDTNGNPTTITVLSDEYLDVIAEIRVYLRDNISGSFNLLNKTGEVISTHSIIGKPAYINSLLRPSFEKISFNTTVGYVYDGNIGEITDAPQGKRAEFIVGPTIYTGLSAQCVYTLPLAVANFTHISFLCSTYLLSSSGNAIYYQFQISPPILKKDTQVMTYTFEISWGRYEST